MTKRKLINKLAHGIVAHFEKHCPYLLTKDARSVLVNNAIWACTTAYDEGQKRERLKRERKK